MVTEFGQYDGPGKINYDEAVLQICADHQIGWAAWAAWAGRPNSHEYGSSIGSTQPDVFTGIDAAGNNDFQLTNPSTAFNSEHQDQPMVKESATSDGSNWAYFWDRFAISSN